MTRRPELKAEIVRLAELGHSAGEIAQALGVTRGVVMGITFRAGVRLTAKASTPHKFTPRLPRAAKASAPLAQRREPRALPTAPGLNPDAPRGVAAAMLALANRRAACHWPHGDPTDESFTFCLESQRPAAQLPYCDYHLELSRAGSPLLKP
jgi:hypothetical protein